MNEDWRKTQYGQGEKIVQLQEADGINCKEACRRLGINEHSGRRCVHEYNKANARGKMDRVETDAGLELSSDGETIKTLEDLLAASNVDLDLWKVDRWEAKSYQGFRRDESKHLQFSDGKITGTVDDDGNIRKATMFAVKAWMVKREERPFEEALDRLLMRVKDMPKPIIRKNYPGGEYLFVPGMSDIHFARLSLDGKYTPQQTIDDMEMAGNALIGRTVAMGLPIKQILLPLGNDMWNTDNLNGTTTRGTWQEMSASMRDAVDAGCYAADNLIYKLSDIAPIQVVIVPGNHDRYTCYWFGKYLQARWGNHPHVAIDAEEMPRKYYQYGQNLIGMEHGDRVKGKDLALIMAQEAPKMWGCTKYRTFFRGHFHKEHEMYTPIADTGGVSVVTFPAFCPPDRWEMVMGYIGGHRAATANFFHWEHGRAGTFPVFIDELGPGPELKLVDRRKVA